MEVVLLKYGFPLIVLVLLLSGFGLPLPEDIPLLATGYLCSFDPELLWVMTPLVLLCVVGADCTLYWLGRRWGHHVPRLPLLRRFLDEKHLARAERAFHKHGGKTLFLARFLPGVRAACFFTAGTFKIPFWKLVVFDGSAALISVPVFVFLGFFFANQFERVKELTHDAQIAVGIALFAILATLIFIKMRRRRPASGNVTP